MGRGKQLHSDLAISVYVKLHSMYTAMSVRLIRGNRFY
jgi:hypothetical protein